MLFLYFIMICYGLSSLYFPTFMILNHIILYSQLFKMDLVVMSIVILCIVSAVLYQGISILEKNKIDIGKHHDLDENHDA